MYVLIKFVKNVHGHTVIKLPAVKVSKSQNFFLKFSFEPKTNENMFVFFGKNKIRNTTFITIVESVFRPA